MSIMLFYPDGTATDFCRKAAHAAFVTGTNATGTSTAGKDKL
jgi:hypothetical protein